MFSRSEELRPHSAPAANRNFLLRQRLNEFHALLLAPEVKHIGEPAILVLIKYHQPLATGRKEILVSRWQLVPLHSLRVVSGNDQVVVEIGPITIGILESFRIGGGKRLPVGGDEACFLH